MSDTPALSEAEEYSKALESIGLLEAKPDPKPDDPPKPADPVPDKPDTPDPAPADAGVSVSEEPFPGFNALSDEAKESVKAKLAEADEAKSRAAEFEKRWKAQHGQLAPTQRELENTRRAAQEMAERLKKIEEAQAKAPPANDALAKFKEQYPDEGAALDAVSKQFDSQTERLARQHAEAQEKLSRLEAHIQRQEAISTLSQRHPDWQDVDASETFKTWLNSAGPYKLALARSGDANATAEVLDDYKRDLALAQALAGQTPTTPVPAKPGKKPDVDPNPTVRQSLGSNASNAGSSEADEYVSALRAAGYEI